MNPQNYQYLIDEFEWGIQEEESYATEIARQLVDQNNFSNPLPEAVARDLIGWEQKRDLDWLGGYPHEDRIPVSIDGEDFEIVSFGTVDSEHDRTHRLIVVKKEGADDG